LVASTRAYAVSSPKGESWRPHARSRSTSHRCELGALAPELERSRLSVASAAEPAYYVDSSAIVKLIVSEPESGALVEAITGHGLVTSEIALAEVPRAIRRLLSGRRTRERSGVERELPRVLEALAYVPLDRALLVRAGSFREAYLRTLDAIHLASALAVDTDIEAVVTYDERQVEAAESAGLVCLSPA
jgi:predicted nucleic acid-binding protein